jgi:hypothetical protein
MPPSLAGTPPLTRPPNRPTNCARSSPRSHAASSVIGDRGDRDLLMRAPRRFAARPPRGPPAPPVRARREYRAHGPRMSRANGGHPGCWRAHTGAGDGGRPMPRPCSDTTVHSEGDPLQGFRKRAPRRRVVRWGRPESEAGEELLDNLGLLDEGFVVSSGERR